MAHSKLGGDRSKRQAVNSTSVNSPIHAFQGSPSCRQREKGLFVPAAREHVKPSHLLGLEANGSLQNTQPPQSHNATEQDSYQETGTHGLVAGIICKL